MSPEQSNLVKGASRHRFAFAMLGAVTASMAWLAVVVSTAMTPTEAKSWRAVPMLPPAVVAIESKVLRQVTRYDCSRRTDSVPVVAPPVPARLRSVVTGISANGRRVETGTVLARVADQAVVAVVTEGVFYRDLTIGLRGADALAFTRALQAAGMTSFHSDRVDGRVLAAWSTVDASAARSGTISWRSLVAVPPRATVGDVLARTAQDVRSGDTLLEVSAVGNSYACQVPDAHGPPRPDQLVLETAGRAVPVSSVTLGKADRGRGAPAPWVVTPASRVGKGDTRLRVVHGAAGDDPVLAVPLRAIETNSSGATAVVVVRGSTQRRLPVALGATAQGWVSVSGAGLTEGTLVRLLGEPS